MWARRAAGGPHLPQQLPGRVSSAYGWRQDPLDASMKFHKGMDIALPHGHEVPAPREGRVVFAGEQPGYGMTVIVEHAGQMRTRYAHLSTTLVASGDEVRAGQVVGRAGHSGRATGTHLHFEVTNANGEPLNPEHFAGLKAEGVVADFTPATNSVLQEIRR